MTPFEFLTSIVLGAVTAVWLMALLRWEGVGFTRALVLGALAGVVGGLISLATNGPAWGEMPYHPMTGLFAVLVGASVVVVLRLLVGFQAPVHSEATRRGR